jgi:hypothetical protein
MGFQNDYLLYESFFFAISKPDIKSFFANFVEKTIQYFNRAKFILVAGVWSESNTFEIRHFVETNFHRENGSL